VRQKVDLTFTHAQTLINATCAKKYDINIAVSPNQAMLRLGALTNVAHFMVPSPPLNDRPIEHFDPPTGHLGGVI